MKNFKNLIKTSGFTLVEVLVTLSILGLVVLAVTSQVNLGSKSRVATNSDSTITSLRDDIILELSNEKTCTANFSGIAMTNTIHNSIKNSEGVDIINMTDSYGKQVGLNISSDNSLLDLVKISSIETILNTKNPNELVLTVKFLKKRGIVGLFSVEEKISVPMIVVKDVNDKLNNCFSDSTLSIATAIRLSCKGNTAFYNPNLNIPYGQCEHTVQPTLPQCPPGQFIKEIGVNLSGAAPDTSNSKALEYRCESLTSSCQPGMVITGTNADGTVNCGFPLPNCSPGQMMIMSNAGKYICSDTNIGCNGLTAIKSFNADGSLTCGLFYPPKTCTGFVTSISPSSVSCGANVKPITCPFGSFIDSFDASATPICKKWINVPASCPPKYGANGIFPNGDIKCTRMDRRSKCNGAVNPTYTNTFNACASLGGSIVNRNVVGATNTFCVFNSSSCPSTWSMCNSYRTTIDNSCVDTHSACTQSLTGIPKIATGTYSLNNSSPNSNTCTKWMRDSGPWVFTCTPVVLPPIYADTVQVGCY